MPARSCTELGAAMVALRVAELRKESTARFVLRNIHPAAAQALREFASQVIDAQDGGAVWGRSSIQALTGPA